MALRLKRKKEGVWVDFPGNEGVRFKIRPLSLTEMGKIRASIRKKIVVRDPGADLSKGEELQKVVDDIDEFELTKAVFFHILEAWEGIEVDGTEDLSQNDWKTLMFDESSIRDFVVSESTKLADELGKQEQAEQKNF